MGKTLYCLVAAVLLLSSCNRTQHRQGTESARTSPSSNATPLAPVSATQTQVAQATQDAARPSPFEENDSRNRVELSTTSPQASQRRRTAAPTEKPFLLADIDRRPAAPAPAAELPVPPTLSPTTSSRLNLLSGRGYFVARATYEAVKPNRLVRVIQKVPGLRRLRRPPDAEQGFSPPRPMHDITFTLPPSSLPQNLDRGRVDLKATVSESGAVTRVELLTPKDVSLLDLASYAASGWQFVPARLNDKAVPSQVLLHFQFDGN